MTRVDVFLDRVHHHACIGETNDPLRTFLFFFWSIVIFLRSYCSLGAGSFTSRLPLSPRRRSRQRALQCSHCSPGDGTYTARSMTPLNPMAVKTPRRWFHQILRVSRLQHTDLLETNVGSTVTTGILWRQFNADFPARLATQPQGWRAWSSSKEFSSHVSKLLPTNRS